MKHISSAFRVGNIQENIWETGQTCRDQVHESSCNFNLWAAFELFLWRSGLAPGITSEGRPTRMLGGDTGAQEECDHP
jgi:hypothetical protein